MTSIFLRHVEYLQDSKKHAYFPGFLSVPGFSSVQSSSPQLYFLYLTQGFLVHCDQKVSFSVFSLSRKLSLSRWYGVLGITNAYTEFQLILQLLTPTMHTLQMYYLRFLRFLWCMLSLFFGTKLCKLRFVFLIQLFNVSLIHQLSSFKFCCSIVHLLLNILELYGFLFPLVTVTVMGLISLL